jgi:tetratricopeptide (TPR) repeat protein
MDSLAGTVLGQGIDSFQKENYEKAIKSFKAAAALSPSSENAFNAYNYMGQAYIKLEDTDGAIKVYKEAIRAFPGTTDDTFHVALGDIYMKQEDMADEAIAMYEKAIAIDPNNGESRYSLGQIFLQSGDPEKASEQFKQVVRINPASATGYYGLGQVARSEGDYANAVSQFERAQSVDKTFALSYRDLGFTYADMGEFDKADNQLTLLQSKNSDYSASLENYISQVTPAKITFATSLDGFITSSGPQTKVSSLSSALKVSNHSKLFSMKFTFSKDMDASSIINSSNWTISRSTLRDNGGAYNYGMKLPATEAAIAPKPAYVLFDKDTDIATVYFRIYQNKNADATIDPRHIIFKFNGIDAYGKAVDASANEYAGFSGIA